MRISSTLSATLVLFSLMVFSAEASTVRVVDKVIDDKHYIVGEVDINADESQVWSVLTDYKGASKVFDNLSECEVVETTESGVLVRQHVKSSLLPFRLKYLVLSKESPRRIDFKSIEGNIQKFEGFWKVLPNPANRTTTVTYAVSITSNSIVPTKLLRKSFRGYSPDLLQQLKRKIENPV
ncbi:MAG: SRPBCC family protein [Candidatus Obscuribacterales bacterium]|nr:SRPBCC family protein [Candidatus Obscuribacterales bacterium]